MEYDLLTEKHHEKKFPSKFAIALSEEPEYTPGKLYGKQYVRLK
jgi:hypothetical protein